MSKLIRELNILASQLYLESMDSFGSNASVESRKRSDLILEAIKELESLSKAPVSPVAALLVARNRDGSGTSITNPGLV